MLLWPWNTVTVTEKWHEQAKLSNKYFQVFDIYHIYSVQEKHKGKTVDTSRSSSHIQLVQHWPLHRLNVFMQIKNLTQRGSKVQVVKCWT